jgi:uncharacterized protein (DUF736 family)
MSDFQQKDMEGSLFKNEKKETDKHPDYTGSATIKGTKYNLAAWISTSKKTGRKYMNLKLSPWGKQEAKTSTPQAAPADIDDDIPF